MELNNVYKDTNYADVVKTMKDKLDVQMLRTGDVPVY
jgi:hypothetical protein